MKQKKSRRHSGKKYLWYSILCVMLLVLAGSTYVLMSFGLIPMTGNKTLDIIIGILLVIISIASIVCGIIAFVYYKRNSNQIRFNYATFELVEGINSERAFLAYVAKDIKRNRGKANALVAFAATVLKDCLYAMGMRKAAKF